MERTYGAPDVSACECGRGREQAERLGEVQLDGLGLPEILGKFIGTVGVCASKRADLGGTIRAVDTEARHTTVTLVILDPFKALRSCR